MCGAGVLLYDVRGHTATKHMNNKRKIMYLMISKRSRKDRTCINYDKLI